MISSALLFTISCTQEEIKTPTDANFDAKYETYYRLASFVEKMQGKEVSYPVLIPRSDYTTTQTRDHIEGAMNLQYTDPGLTWEDYDEESDTFTITITGGVVTEANVEALFDDVTEFASAHFYGIAEEDKFPYLYDATIISATTNSMQLALSSVVGLRHRDPTPFGENDYWSVFNEGLCDPNDPSTLSASDLQNDALNDWFLPVYCVLWTNLENVGTDELLTHGWQEDNPNEAAGDWIMDYRTFFVECTTNNNHCSQLAANGVFCLAPDEMNFYFQQIVGIYNAFSNAEDLDLRMSGFGLATHGIQNGFRHYWTGSNRWGVANACVEGGPFPYALPQCC